MIRDKITFFSLCTINIILAVIIVILTAIMLLLGSRAYSEPEVLEIGHNGEGLWYEEPIKLHENYIPTDEAYEKLLKEFIRGIRMVGGFFDINQELVLKALFCSTGNAYQMMKKSLEEQNPFEVSNSYTIDVPLNSITITKISQNQWKASWRERTYNRSGEKTMEADYEAVFHTTLGNVPDTKDMNNPKDYNPLGILVYDYDIDLLRKLM